MKKLLTWLALAIAVIWVVHNPTGAAAMAHQAAHALTTLATHL